MEIKQNKKQWQDDDSNIFVEWGKLFTPKREEVIEVFVKSIPKNKHDQFHVVELGCGLGWLSKSILQNFPYSKVTVLDGSQVMLQHAKEKLAEFEGRVTFDLFRLENIDWIYQYENKVDCFVSSLAIHHIDGEEKKILFQRLHDVLLPGGALIVADVLKAQNILVENYWANKWDQIVKEQSRAQFGDERGFTMFIKEEWNMYRHSEDPIDKPSSLMDQLTWLEQAGFQGIDVYWLNAGHAIFGGYKEKSSD
ncbi:trans-aconitate 2-methyltransferase [Mechercharimyces sp. CAU 1602]|uniref:class I SAM-dependent methyltransferase n=1 Tax=Mechercharimyces sp. CAU 1602 TaxID=2973933 RepID=UPI002161F9E8|nr:class I SAM-dependent methyltransferase [Mechercharimyces sp. CAU 1602]MCS1352457.1 class I SAM-dependent methyltransferase [Mechercharimyces sp. CAU 1602]